jgi:hypothetical protein
MFFRDRTNLMVMSVYVISCVIGFWTAFGVNVDWVPRVSLLVMLSMATLGFLLMAPYFAYVFDFLAPKNVVARLQEDAIKHATNEASGARSTGKLRALGASDQLSDIAINSISQKDKIIAVACVDALRDLTLAYLDAKPSLAKGWFVIDEAIRQNPDFASMAEDSLEDVEVSGTWFEFKQLRQFQAIYTEALGSMRDINYAIAINTRRIAEHARNVGDEQALQLAVKFFNTYLRATLNRNEVRTAYTILNPYRKLVEHALVAGDNPCALKLAQHMQYYGRLFYERKLAFVTETVAYDLGSLCETAHNARCSVERELLRIFLSVDPSISEGDVQEASLRGVRKAQLKVATFYLSNGAPDMAREIWEDMRDENVERLLSIRDELLSIESKDFWEISDRGGNFDYLDPEQKKRLREFFGWFRDVSGELKAVSMDAPE